MYAYACYSSSPVLSVLDRTGNAHQKVKTLTERRPLDLSSSIIDALPSLFRMAFGSFVMDQFPKGARSMLQGRHFTTPGVRT